MPHFDQGILIPNETTDQETSELLSSKADQNTNQDTLILMNVHADKPSGKKKHK